MSQPDQPQAGNLTGSLLVATPGLMDPNFRRSILFLSHHSAELGATGFILNRPVSKTLADISKNQVAPGVSTAPLYVGGPVGHESVVLASLQWRETASPVAFHTFDPEMAFGQQSIPEEWQPGLRAFIGYAGWTKGQLESEIAQKSWFVLAPTRPLIEMTEPQTAWRDLLRGMDPLLKLLADAPDDPSLN